MHMGTNTVVLCVGLSLTNEINSDMQKCDTEKYKNFFCNYT